MSGWTTIESDPGVFSELTGAFGARGVSFEELWTLEDDEALRDLAPLGLLFLFKWQGGKGGGSGAAADAHGAPVWFARQTISNACATQAILHILLNQPEAGPDAVDIGPTLRELKGFTAGLDPASRGSVFNSYDAVRVAHNSFARPEPFLHEEKVATKDDDVYHFIAYTRTPDGAVWQLDGLARDAVKLADGAALPGPDAGLGWLGAAREALLQQQVALEEAKAARAAALAEAEGASSGGGEGPETASALAAAKQVNELGAKVREATKRLMAAVAELSLHQATEMKLAADVEAAHKAKAAAEEAAVVEQPPTAAAEMRLAATQRATAQLAAMHAAAAAAAEAGPDAAAARPPPRPNAYIPEGPGLGLPKPFPGAFQPFAPSK